jgi:hypothetical protein
MSRILLVLAASFTFVFASFSASDVKAADARMSPGHASYGRYCQDIWRVGPDGGKWYQVCTSPCPDGISCSPLYGAYGPYGGVRYWGAYSDSGWSYYR